MRSRASARCRGASSSPGRASSCARRPARWRARSASARSMKREDLCLAARPGSRSSPWRRTSPCGNRRRMIAASGCAGSPDEYTRSTCGCAAQPRGHAAGVGALALHAQRERLDAAHGQVAFERSEHRADDARKRAQRLVVLLRRRRPTPPSTSPWPARYLVTLWTTMCAPSSSGRTSSGVANVLSTISAAPAARADLRDLVERAPRAAADSRSSPSEAARACPLSAPPRTASRSQMSTKSHLDAERLQHLS